MIVGAPLAPIFAPAWDVRWLRYTLSLLTVVVLVMNTSNLLNPSGPPELPWAACGLNILFGVLLITYSGHLLIWRLQCSLLDLVVIAAFTGNILGVFLTVPGLRAIVLPLLPAAIGWVLLGSVNGMVYARILNCRSQFLRVVLFLFAWLQYLDLPFALLSAFLFSLKDNPYSRWFGEEFLSYRYTFLGMAVAIFLLNLAVHRRISTAAKARQSA
jgi:hypothetical protein